MAVLKGLSKETFGNMDFRLREMGDKIKDVDMLAEGRDLVVVEVANRNQCLEQLISTSV